MKNNVSKWLEIAEGFSVEIQKAVLVAIEAGMVINTFVGTANMKAGDGHRSVITKNDECGQTLIMDQLKKTFPQALFLGEEDSGDTNILSKHQPVGLSAKGVRFIIDPIDGTTLYAARLGNWSVVIGVMVDGELVGSVIFAPTNNSGLLVVAEKGNGLFAIEDGYVEKLPVLSPVSPNASVVLLGVDTLLYSTITQIIPTIAANVRGMYVSGSGALGLAQVAIGRAQAIIQTPQKAWDWAGAYRLVIEAGGTFAFFKLNAGNLIWTNEISFSAFCYASENRLGFIAGEPSFVERLKKLLPVIGWSRLNPDIVSGNW